jgi:hypothetical protein
MMFNSSSMTIFGSHRRHPEFWVLPGSAQHPSQTSVFLTMQSSTGATGAAHNSNCRTGRRLVLPVTEKVQSLADFDVALAKVILH